MTTLPFSEHLRHERELRGWSQAVLAEKVRCDTKTVGRWESGGSIPRPYHRQLLCELFGKNAEELGLVSERVSQPPALENANEDDLLSPLVLREDWGEAPNVFTLYGRDEDLAELARWIGDHRCQIVAVLGAAGVGKTALATKVAEQVKQAFEYIFWRSLQNAPPLELVLKQCIKLLSDQQQLDLPEEVDGLISLLTQYLRNHRCLLVLDNFETVLQPGQLAGYFREGYAAYGKLLQRVGEARHQGCLLLTSREKPKEVAHLEGKSSPVRSLHLAGIQVEAGRKMLQDKGLVGSGAHWRSLVEHYSGNPLALQVVSEPIQEVFEGEIARFLQEDVIAFGDINDLLDQQFHRLSAMEREIMYWLSIEREAISLDGLREDLAYPIAAGTQIEALDSLRRRSLIERRGSTGFTLQPVIMEYASMKLIEQASSEFDTDPPEVWAKFAFIKAQAKDYVRESQVRLLLAPLAQRLLAKSGKQGIERQVEQMLAKQRRARPLHPGYLAGNILNLLSHLQYSLRGIDCSHLTVRQAYLQSVLLPLANFAHARFVASIFSNTFGNILAVACHSREHLFAAGTASAEILIYDLLSGALLLTCQGHSDGVWSLAFSPDGGLLVSSSDDHTIRLWNTRTGECLRTLEGHTNRVRAVAFNPDGGVLASGSDDTSIRLWNVNTGECLRTLPGHTDRVWSVAFSPNGEMLASGSTDQTLRLWESGKGTCLMTLHGHEGWVRSVAFLEEGHILASGSDDRTLRLWDTRTGECLRTLVGHSSRVWSVVPHPTKHMVVSSSEDRSIRLWDISSGRCIMLLRGHYEGVRSVAPTSDGQTLVSGGDDQTIRIWDISEGYCLRTTQGYTNRIWSAAFHPSGSLLASAGEDSAIRLWDVQTGQCLRVLQDQTHGVLAIAFNPHNATIASGGQDQTVRVWDTHTGRCLKQFHGHSNWVRAVAVHPDGDLLASGGEDQAIRLWDVRAEASVYLLQGHTSWVRSLSFSPDGTLLASGADDQTIRLWNTANGLHLKTLESHTGRVRTVVFSPNGNLLASGSEDQTIRLWDAQSGRCLNLFYGHTGWIRSVDFSPDGNLLASGGEDQTIRLWDVQNGRCITMLRGHANRVRCVMFNPDEQMLASSSDDGTIKLWDLQTGACIKTLISERPYERMNIAHAQGLTEAQKANLRALGAIEENSRFSPSK